MKLSFIKVDIVEDWSSKIKLELRLIQRLLNFKQEVGFPLTLCFTFFLEIHDSTWT